MEHVGHVRICRANAPSIVFLSANSGGGHNGTARALIDCFERALGRPVPSKIVDIYQGRLSKLPWLARLRNHSNLLWACFACVTAWAPASALIRKSMRRQIVRTAIAQIDRDVDILIAVHFVGAMHIAAIADALPKRPFTLIVATDYSPHRAWFGRADLTVVSCTPGARIAARYGVNDASMYCVPLLPCGVRRCDRDEMSASKFPICVVAAMGADGTSGRRLVALIRMIDRCEWATRVRLEVVCGNNHALLRTLTAMAAQLLRLRIDPIAYAADLPARIAAADIALLRSSPLILTEALCSGTPVLAFDWHAHERANASLLSLWRCGFASRSIASVVAVLEQWVVNPGVFSAVRARARTVAALSFGADATRDILNRSGFGEGINDGGFGQVD